MNKRRRYQAKRRREFLKAEARVHAHRYGPTWLTLRRRMIQRYGALTRSTSILDLWR